MSIAPGFHDLTAAEYHADPCTVPSLSSSIANIIIDKTPRHAWQAHPRLGGVSKKSTKEMDFGTVAHEIVLGKGGGFHLCPHDDFRLKPAKDWLADNPTPRGKVLIKARDFDVALQMAASIRKCLDATPGAERAFLDGESEKAMIWGDIGGVTCRSLIDWLALGSEPCIWDFKTIGTGMSDRELAMTIADGYDLQAAFYLRGFEQLLPDMAGRVKWRWVFAEKTLPYEARVIELDSATRALGDKKAAWAIEVWRRCLAENRWPGWPREIRRVEYPSYAENRWIEREMADEEGIAADAITMSTPIASRPSMITEFVG